MDAGRPAVTNIRVTSVGKVRSFVAGALEALSNGTVKLHAQGPAVSKAVTVAEIAKRRLRGLHQNTQIGLTAERAEGERSVPTIAITLSLVPLDAAMPGCALVQHTSDKGGPSLTALPSSHRSQVPSATNGG